MKGGNSGASEIAFYLSSYIRKVPTNARNMSRMWLLQSILFIKTVASATVSKGTREYPFCDDFFLSGECLYSARTIFSDKNDKKLRRAYLISALTRSGIVLCGTRGNNHGATRSVLVCTQTWKSR